MTVHGTDGPNERLHLSIVDVPAGPSKKVLDPVNGGNGDMERIVHRFGRQSVFTW
jgi:hypothetical protein